MSDVSQGRTWWQASDGKWYPPEQQPDYGRGAKAQHEPPQGRSQPKTAPQAVVTAASTSAINPPADWYDNPLGDGLRYWDGVAWTQHIARLQHATTQSHLLVGPSHDPTNLLNNSGVEDYVGPSADQGANNAWINDPGLVPAILQKETWNHYRDFQRDRSPGRCDHISVGETTSHTYISAWYQTFNSTKRGPCSK